ncbi:MAG: two-component system response regulator [Ignavibacteriae bacterium HGW-Ignavibacteriae-2]|jgi:DNA-binding NtrC family response regulator|nr:MAG: two-component system response regulator [Ignavibacteriae bacterium HGW-Ignavibacteriae-2]
MGAALYPSNPVLIVDDEEQFLLSVELTLSANGINNLQTISDSRKVMQLLSEKEFSLVMLDINMPNITGLELLPKIVEKHPEIPVIIITAINDVDNAVFCIKEGAFNYILKPVDNTRLVTTIRSGLNLRDVTSENVRLKKYLLKDELEYPETFSHIITQSPAMRAIFKYIEAIARTQLPVLITGETGAGKELIAKAIHDISKRTGKLVPVNVAGVDDTLFSDTLFGHKKGAFTSAEKERQGLIEQAEKGSLFLDEIGDLSIESQVKLLRLLQDGKYFPLGSDMAKLSDARIICATHRDIETMKDNNSFRKDLYYRLQAHHIHIPPLRERKKDLPLLIDHFLEKAAAQLNKNKPTAPKELKTLLSNYSFPGNIRELEGIIFDAVSVYKSGILSLDSIKEKVFGKLTSTENGVSSSSNSEELGISFADHLPTLKESEDLLIKEALKRADGNQTIAAQLLGISRRALNNRIQRKNSEE